METKNFENNLVDLYGKFNKSQDKMRPVKRRRIGLLTKDRGADGVNEPEQERRVTVVEEGDAITVTFDGDTEEELEDELDEDEVEEGNHSSMDSSPLTTRVLIRYISTFCLFRFWQNIILFRHSIIFNLNFCLTF